MEITAESLYDGAEIQEELPIETEETEVKAEESEEQEVKAEAAPETGEKEEESSSEDQQEASPAPEGDTKVPMSVVHGERDRRKAAESRAKELEEKLAATESKETTSVFEDEAKFRQELEAGFDAKIQQTMLAMSERFSRRHHGDEKVDSAIDWFKEAAPESPVLVQKFNESGNDVDKVVQLYESHLEAQKLEDVDAYKEQLKAEAKAEALAELKAEQAEKSKLRKSIPDSLVDDSSAGGLSSKDWGGPPPAEDLYN